MTRRLPSSKRRSRILFQVGSASRNALGGKAPAGWTDLEQRFARVLYGTGAERRSAAQETAVKTATFRCLADDLTRTITVRHRIVHAGVTYDITDVSPIGEPKPTEIEFTGTAKLG